MARMLKKRIGIHERMLTGELIGGLKGTDGNVLTEQADLERIGAAFYANLYGDREQRDTSRSNVQQVGTLKSSVFARWEAFSLNTF
eukprot:Nk52_evm11s2011 gene=Nk52_evmTU11s2011